MGRRSKIYEILDKNIESDNERDIVKTYISNLLKANSEMEKSISNLKKNKIKNSRRNKKIDRWINKK